MVEDSEIDLLEEVSKVAPELQKVLGEVKGEEEIASAEVVVEDSKEKRDYPLKKL